MTLMYGKAKNHKSSMLQLELFTCKGNNKVTMYVNIFSLTGSRGQTFESHWPVVGCAVFKFHIIKSISFHLYCFFLSCSRNPNFPKDPKSQLLDCSVNLAFLSLSSLILFEFFVHVWGNFISFLISIQKTIWWPAHWHSS